MLLVDEEKTDFKPKKVFELVSGNPQVSLIDANQADSDLLKHALGAQKITYSKDKAMASLPLSADSKFLGALIIEGLEVNMLEKFSILAHQFSLEFKRASFYQKIEELAITDGLTGLFVRRYFLQRLYEETERSLRHKLKISFLMIDIDHFKQCNDKYGHLTGDVVLREVADKVSGCVREIDLVARYGGEEFCVLLPDTDKDAARDVAERIRQNIEQSEFSAYDEVLRVNVSIGVADFPHDSNNPSELIDKADQALYQAKQQGRNRVCLFRPFA